MAVHAPRLAFLGRLTGELLLRMVGSDRLHAPRFFLVPRYMHRSALPHNRVAVARRYFEACHYIAHLETLLSEGGGVQQRQQQPPQSRLLWTQSIDSTCAGGHMPFSGDADHQSYHRRGASSTGVRNASIWLARLDAIWQETSRDLHWIMDSVGLHWLRRSTCGSTLPAAAASSVFDRLGVHAGGAASQNSRQSAPAQNPSRPAVEGIIRRHTRALVATQSADSRLFEPVPSQLDKATRQFERVPAAAAPDQTAALLRLQLIAACVGLQCLHSSMESPVEWTSLQESLRQDRRAMDHLPVVGICRSAPCRRRGA